jgi:hypothetical protein
MTMETKGEDLVTLYDEAPLNTRYWVSMALAVTTSIFDFFDFFIVGFLVAVGAWILFAPVINRHPEKHRPLLIGLGKTGRPAATFKIKLRTFWRSSCPHETNTCARRPGADLSGRRPLPTMRGCSRGKKRPRLLFATRNAETRQVNAFRR